MRRAAAACVILSLLPGTAPAATPPPDRELAKGIQLAREGDFEGALLTLDEVAHALAGTPARSKELAQAYLHIGVAYVGLGQASLARTKFRQAMALDPSLRLGTGEFPARVIRAFEEARGAAATEATLEKEAKKKRGKGGLILLGAGGLAAGGLALTLTRERSNEPPTASIAVAPAGTVLANATRVTFTATGSDPDGEPIRYSWDFGDGGTAEGDSVAHVFERVGTSRVVLSAHDGLTATRVETSVTVGTMTGTWRPLGPMIRDERDFTLTQSGTSLLAVPTYADGSRGTTAAPNGVSDPRRVSFRYLDPRQAVGGVFSCNYGFIGQADETLLNVAGTATCDGSVNCACLGQQRSVTLTRQ